MMKMWNTSTRIPDVKRGKFVTDKLEAEGHGWGIESVKRLVKDMMEISHLNMILIFFR